MSSATRRFAALALAALFAAPAPVLAQDTDWTAVDAALRKEIAAREYTGVGVIALQDGVPVFIGSYGFADLEHHVPVRPQTLFQSGSVGKMFTATAVVLLAQEGRLELDDPLAKYFPDGPAYWQRATLRHVLSHRAGIPNYTEQDSTTRPGIDYRREYSDEELALIIGAAPMDFEPGTNYHYSDSGYVLLGLVAGQAAGEFYGDYLARRVFRPLGMATAQVNDIDAVVANRAASYERDKQGSLLRAGYVSRSLDRTGDGSLLFSVLDLAHWDAALRGDALLPQAVLRSMWQAEPFSDGTRGLEDYGMGWVTRQVRGHLLVEHSGWWQGFNAYIGRYVDDGFTLAVLCNSDWAREDLDTFASFAASLRNPDYGAYAPIADADPASSARFADLTRAYLAGRPERAAYDSVLAPRLSARQAARLADDAGFKKVPGFVLVHEREKDGLRLREYRMSDGEASVIVRYSLAPNGKVRDFGFQPD